MLRFWCCFIVFASSLLSISTVPGDDDAPQPAPDVDAVVTLLDLVIDADEATARDCLGILTRSLQNGQLSPERVDAIRDQLSDRLTAILADADNPLRFDAALLTTSWKDPVGTRISRETFASTKSDTEDRLAALEALIAAGDAGVLTTVQRALSDPDHHSVKFRGQVLTALARLDQPDVAGLVLSRFDDFEPELKPRAVELLTQRPGWTKSLLAAVAAEKIDKGVLNLNQLRRISTFKDEKLQEQFHKLYGTIRDGRDPKREQLVNRMRDFLKGTPGDPHRGIAAFKKLCAQCHKIYGEGADVGPDITRNGRNDWNQLLSNVFDPSLVIGPGYQARQLLTVDGRVVTGLAVEENEQRVVLKVQGGKLETIPRDQIDLYQVSQVSMMPEQLETQFTPQELADLMAFLALDKHPDDPEARYLPGAPRFESQGD